MARKNYISAQSERDGEDIKVALPLLVRAAGYHECEGCGHHRAQHSAADTSCELQAGRFHCKCQKYVGVMPPSYEELLEAVIKILFRKPGTNWKRVMESYQ